MDYHIIFYIAIALVLVDLGWHGLQYRKLFRQREMLRKTSHIIDHGVPTIVCKQCHETTHRFQYRPEGGALCAKCSNWL